jgi:hypothetical protein
MSGLKVPRPEGIGVIYTAGYPRSGNTWLNRLLSDLLSSPLQTLPGEPMEYFGDAGGKFVIRKTHCREYEADERQGEEEAQWVFIQRDPRDVAVSRYFYANLPTMAGAIKGLFDRHADYYPNTFHEQGNYEIFIRSWMESDRAVVKTKYETLHEEPIDELQRIVTLLRGGPMPVPMIRDKIERQAFRSIKKRYGDRFGHSMRKGIAGDWQVWFSRDDGKLIQDGLGDLMLEQGYIDDPDWWQKLPENARMSRTHA